MNHKMTIQELLNGLRNEFEQLFNSTNSMKTEYDKLMSTYKDLETQQHGCYDIMIKLKMDVLYNQQVIQKLQHIIANILSQHVNSQEEQSRLANLVESCKTLGGVEIRIDIIF